MLPLIVGIGVAVVVAILLPVVAPALLGIIGFGALGPIAGSFAAAIQAIIGNVAVGSLFATLQSIAMGGLAAIPVVIHLTCVAIAGGLSAAVIFFSSDIWSLCKEAASAVGAYIGSIADKASEAVASIGPGLIALGKPAAATIIDAIRSIAKVTGKDL